MADLRETLNAESRSFGFFQAVSMLEEFFGNHPACTDPLRDGRIRFESDTATTFPVADIAGCHSDIERTRLRLSFMSLLGASSPLPQYFSDEVLRHGEEDTALSDFLDMFANRVYALFYQAWKKHHLLAAMPGERDSAFARIVKSIAGAFPHMDTASRAALSAYAGLFATASRSANGMATLVSDFLGNVPVEVVEHVPRWAPLHSKTQLGLDTCLGDNSVVGDAVWDITTKFRVVVGPLGRERYEEMLHDSETTQRLATLIERYLTEPLEFDIEVQLAGLELVPVVLGERAAGLGETSCLGRADSAPVAHSVIHSTESA